MSRTPDALPDRVAAALCGAAAGESSTGAPAGVRSLLDLADLLAERGMVDDLDLRQRGLDTAPPTGGAGLLPRGALVGMLTPLDRPRLRRDAHRIARAAGADEGTALVTVATAVLAADLLRFDLDTALVRLRQTLLEEAPLALHARLAPLPAGVHMAAAADPGAALQVAISALHEAGSLPEAVAAALDLTADPAAAAPLAGVLAGARWAFAGVDAAWLAEVPAGARCREAGQRLGRVAAALLPRG